MIKGIDVSMWQGNINFTKVKTQDIKIVYIKATEGTSIVDPKFEQNYKNAKNNGLKVGVYHFFRANQNIETQANLLYGKIKDKNLDCKIAIDVETTQGLSKVALSNLVESFAEKIMKLTGLEIVIYTYTSFANDNLNSSLAKYPLWIAEYGVSTPKKNKVWGGNYVGWQYSEKGNINGSEGDSTDLDYFTDGIFLGNRNDNKEPNKNTTSKIVAGSKVKMTGQRYYTGETIPNWVKTNIYTVQSISGEKVLIKEIDSFVYLKDLILVSTSDQNKEPNKNPASKIVVGSKIKIIGQKYYTGQTIPNWVKENVYTVQSISGEKVLIKEITSFVYLKDLILVSSQSETYKIKSGDTLGAIATKFNTTVAKLAKLNNIKNTNLIYIGQVIRIS